MYVCSFQVESLLIRYAQKKLSPEPRSFYWHETSVIVRRPYPQSPPLMFCTLRQDTTSTTALLLGVREGILLSQLSESSVI